MEPFRDFGLTAVSIQSVGSTDHVPFDAAGLPGFQFIQDRIAGHGRAHQPRLLRHAPGRGPDEERRGRGLLRLAGGHGRRAHPAQAAEIEQ
ncbi:MAG: hypothetical protein MZV63_64450 [Marinilabiliales bacterium]|nr:hypothetical protein [Marinilabiliales bacterium]